MLRQTQELHDLEESTDPEAQALNPCPKPETGNCYTPKPETRNPKLLNS